MSIKAEGYVIVAAKFKFILSYRGKEMDCYKIDAF